MANRNFAPVQGSIERGVVVLAGILDIHSDASVLSTSFFAGGTFTKSGTGEYTLTLTDKYNELLACSLTVEAATAVDLVPQIDNHDVSSAKTIVFNLNAAATPTNPSAVCKVHVLLVLKNSSVSSR